MKRYLAIAFAAFATIPTLAACGSDPAAEPDVCASEPVDRFKELMVIDEAVTSDVRAKNGAAGSWSFRFLVENMAPPGMDTSTFVLEWLTEWDAVKQINGFPADRPNELRGSTLVDRIICPWLKQTQSNGCDAKCGVCAERKLDMARAPFRLIAISNRLDERETNPGAPQGEGRLLFGLTDGPADDPASPPLPMTLIFEYLLHEGKSLQEWASMWHALGRNANFDEAFRAQLQQVTDSFTKRGARPGGVNGSALNQLRSNESALNWIWQLREFAIMPDGRLKQRSVRNTPGEALNGSPQLATWVRENAELVRTGKYQIPVGFQAPTADALLFRWRLPGVDEPTRVAFSTATCSGCHTIDKPRIDTAFHISPFRTGTDKLSRFVYDPAGGPDELSRRADGLRKIVCSR
ncbi:MAG: hypothetical protein U0183_12510 [Polyangiaceae bacterium]